VRITIFSRRERLAGPGTLSDGDDNRLYEIIVANCHFSSIHNRRQTSENFRFSHEWNIFHICK